FSKDNKQLDRILRDLLSKYLTNPMTPSDDLSQTECFYRGLASFLFKKFHFSRRLQSAVLEEKDFCKRLKDSLSKFVVKKFMNFLSENKAFYEKLIFLLARDDSFLKGLKYVFSDNQDLYPILNFFYQMMSSFIQY
ncbi:hypothetical protein DI09_417p10, partial [Mitosporidium daphniae]